MELNKVEEYFNLGYQYFYSLQRVFIVQGIDRGRPKKKVKLLDPETGKIIWSRAEALNFPVRDYSDKDFPYYSVVQVTPAVGRYRVIPCWLSVNNRLVPHTSIQLQDGEEVTYLGLAKQTMFMSVVFKRKSGEVAKCPFGWVKAEK